MRPPRSGDDAFERRFLLAAGATALLAGLVMAARPALIAVSARAGATPLALLATRELGLALAALGALLGGVGRDGGPLLCRRAIAILGVLSGALGLNHIVRLATEVEPLFEPAHSYGEAAGLLILAAASALVVARGQRRAIAS